MGNLLSSRIKELQEPGPTEMICDIAIFKNKFLGRGAFGSVFIGKLNGELCAVKVLSQLGMEICHETLELFERECDFLEKIDHANVVHHIASRIHPESNTPVLALELLDCSLTQYLKQSTTDLLMKTQVSLCCDVASALAYLHESPRNIVHRDLCSDNILLRLADPIPVAKVGDFGMSRIIDCTSHRHSLTAMGHREGYMPPETSSSNYDSSLDIYMFGIVMIQIAKNIHYIGSERKPFELWKGISTEHPLNEPITSSLHEDKHSRPKSADLHKSLCIISEKLIMPSTALNSAHELGPMQMICDIAVFKNQSLQYGAFGSVCKGKLNGELCAVKVLSQSGMEIQHEALERFMTECDFLQKIDHANVVHHIASRIHSESNTPVVVLELLDCSLTQYLKQSTTDLPMKTQVSLCCDITSALEYLHDPQRNIVHRDLCSDTILLRLIDPIPVAKVGEFGMSRNIDCNSRRHNPAVDYREGYMPPGVSSSNYDSSHDIYMFGAVMIQIVRRLHHIGSEQEWLEHLRCISKEHPLNEAITICLHEVKQKRPTAKALHKSLCVIADQSLSALNPVQELGPTHVICDIVIFKDQFLGEGAFGSVFMGKLHRKFCAVKVLRPLVHEIKAVLPSVSRTIQLEALERFKRECDFLEKIDHANVVHHIASRIHPESNTPVLALELLDCSLTQYLKQSTTDLPMKTQISLCCDVASALAYLHESPRNIVHRDLCSDNILLRLADPIPVAKVTDFGMSRIIDYTSHRHSLTAMGHREGYMPPEASSSNYDSSLDIFMFGVVMIQIAQNIHYIGSERERFELWKRMPRKHPLNEDITSCLHKDKEKRIKAVTVHHSLRLILEDFTFPQHDVSYREDNLPLSIFGDSDSLCEYLDNYSDLSISNLLDSSSVSVPINIRPDVLLQALQAQDSSPIAEITNLPIQPQSNRPQTLPPAALHTNDSVETVDYPSVDQLSKLSKTLKQRFKKIGVIYFSIADSSIATNIVELFNVLLSGGLCIVQAMDMTKDSSQWFHKLCDAGVDYYLFVGLPPLGKLKGFTPSPEEKFFDPTREGQRVGEVVVVTTKSTPLSPGGRAMDDHYLSKFLHLDSITPETTANRALALFAGTCPVIYPIENVQWSANPKLVVIREGGYQSPELSIMTKEIYPTSQFPRIVVIKSFNQDCIQGNQEKLGKYTHIQSLNGVFLDGMNISEATNVFQTSKATEAQLIVRYIHPLKEGDHPPNTPFPVTPAPLKPQAPRCSLTTEVLPIPVFILGDIATLCSELFRLLSLDAESPHSDVSQGSSSVSSPRHPPSSVSSQPQFASLTSESSLISQYPDEGSDVPRPLSAVRKDINGRKMSKHVVKSNETFERASIPFSLFRNLPTLPQTPSRPNMTLPDTAVKHFILHLRPKELDRHFAHIYLRSSGMYLIVTSLEDMMEDPLIQFENLCYWLRLVETYVAPNEVKRIIIVGMYKASTGSQLAKIERCVSMLNDALREADFKQIMVHSRSEYIFRFNRVNPMDSRKQLCASISKCMNVINERTWYYEKEFFESSMRPFAGFGNVLTYLSEMKKVVASADEISGLCSYSDLNYFRTLEAYSTACISTTGAASLLQPLFIEHLVKSMVINIPQENDVTVFSPSAILLKDLPVVTAPWLTKKMDNLVTTSAGKYQLKRTEQDEVLRWAEKLELMFNISVKDGELHYFVPFLATAATDFPTFSWDENEADSFNVTKCMILYASLHFPATHNFFCRLIANLLKDFLKDAKQGNKCFINFGCMEAILPMKCESAQQRQELSVYLKYNPLQNIIEFRTKAALQQKMLYEAAESLLYIALSQSKYKINFGEAVSFSTPSQEFIPHSALWELGGIGIDSVEDGELLNLRQLTGEEMKNWV